MRRGDAKLIVFGAASGSSLVGRGPYAHALIALSALIAVGAAGAAVVAGPLALAIPVALAACAFAVAYPPALVAAFVFVPFFEAAPFVRSIPFDPTVSLGALLLAVYVYRLSAHRVARPPAGFAIPMLAIGIAMAVGLLGTSEPAYGGEKVLKYFTVTAVAVAAPFFVIRTRAEVVQFVSAIAVGGLLVALATPLTEPTVVAGITTQYDLQGRYSFGGQIFPARFLCTAALVLFVLPGFTRARWRYLAPLAAAGVTFVALGYGARGPIAAFAGALAAVGLLSALRAPRQAVLVLVVVMVGGMVLPFVSLPGQSAERLAEVVTDPVGALSGDTRAAVYSKALELTAEHPLTGIGTGGFFTYTSIVSQPKFPVKYPHNIFLELSSEVGIGPAILLALPILAGIASLLRRLRTTRDPADRHLLTLLMGLFLLNFLATQFSGDINDNRTFFLFLALIWLVGRDGLPRPSSTDAAQP